MESSARSLAVMITTHNRVDDLRRTIGVIKAMQPQPDEILVTADGCTDGTVSLVKSLLPNARLFINEQGIGSVASRDRMLREAATDLVLSLDDDSYPEQPDCIARLKALFNSVPELAVAHFPQRSDEYPESLSQTDFGGAKLTGSYPNSGACYRRADYLALAGFPVEFFHAYEEPDFALQVVCAGKLVMYFPNLTIRHHFSPVERNEIRTHHRHARNELWSALMRCPFPLVLVMVPYRLFSQARYAASRGMDWLVREPVWWWQASRGVWRMLRERSPVSVGCYRSWLKLLGKPVEYDLS